MRLAPTFTHNIQPTPEKKWRGRNAWTWMDNILFTHHRDLCSVASLSLSLPAKEKILGKFPPILLHSSLLKKKKIKDDILE
jgi:hypothetical protein